MTARKHGALAVATLALAIASAVGLVATGPAADEHVAQAVASATRQLLR